MRAISSSFFSCSSYTQCSFSGAAASTDDSAISFSVLYMLYVSSSLSDTTSPAPIPISVAAGNTSATAGNTSATPGNTSATEGAGERG